jgi:hypothetical protein
MHVKGMLPKALTRILWELQTLVAIGRNSVWLGDLPITWCLVHLITYGPPNYSGAIWVNRIFSTKDVGNQVGLFVHVKAIAFRGPLIFVMLVSGLHIDLDQVEDEAPP